MSYDSEMKQSNELSEGESDISYPEEQAMTKKERQDEKKHLQSDIQAMMEQLGAESAIKTVAPVAKKVKQPVKEVQSTEASSIKIEPKKVNFS